MKKFFKYFLFSILVVLLIIIGYVLITFPPVMAGMAAKTVCSCLYVTGRTLESVKEKELQVFPGLSSSTITPNDNDSTVTATILWKTSKAIFRKGLGCTLLSERTEDEVRNQPIRLGSLPANNDTIPWPSGDLVRDSSVAGLNYDLVNQALAEAFTESDPTHPKNTHAVVVVYKNQLIGEKYADGFDRNSKLMGWSMTKSITNALVGILVNQGKLKVEDPAPVPEWANDDRRKISLHHLLQASSGLSWSESYFSPTADFHQMFIKRDDKGGYTASKELAHEPGSFFQYSSGTTNLLSRIIRQTVGDDDYYKFPYENLFYKIGMRHALMEVDASGTFVASSYSYATARDWARFGILYANDGVWNGERILPAGWVKYTVTPAPAADLGKYGAQWWLNAGEKSNPAARKYPELPPDAYWADGFEEQFVMVIPSKDLVIVRLGVSHHGFEFPKMVNGIIAALPEETK